VAFVCKQSKFLVFDKFFKIFIKMESKLDNLMDSMMQNENVIGTLVSDKQGLLYGCE
jgi:Ragulator complex protein LAMTOR5